MDAHVMARKIVAAIHGEEAIKGKLVHHRDGNPHNNSPENLQICESQAEHRRLHKELREQKGIPKLNSVISITFPDDSYAALKEKAEQDGYKVAQLARLLIERALKARRGEK